MKRIVGISGLVFFAPLGQKCGDKDHDVPVCRCLRLTPSCAALVETEHVVRPSLRPITRVGVSPLASRLSSLISSAVHSLPLLRVNQDIHSLFQFSQRAVYRSEE